MTSPNLRADIYNPKTLAAMDQAFAAVWRTAAIGTMGTGRTAIGPTAMESPVELPVAISAEESSGSETPTGRGGLRVAPTFDFPWLGGSRRLRSPKRKIA